MSTITNELVELGKFFTITGRRLAAGNTAPEMFSGAIDAAWHLLAADAEAHAEFTATHAGRGLLHVEGSGEGFVSWVAAYQEVYGQLPEIWFTDAEGMVNTEALARYRESGEVWASWKCSPEAVPAPVKTTSTTR
ncbi:hypothetical protein [Kitasatospora sp. NPDC090091]|uniref:hypothetical protein n=1 Tax=Kitasatospora sp. NPDC090091 TaxID=3364081 RepID=UPI003824E5B5